MILPIVAYGTPVLRKVAEEIPKDYPNLKELVDNMFETMYAASGVGLAAPQVGLSLRLFLVDSKQILDEDPGEFEGEEGIVQAFINPEILEKTGELWPYNEGCLSIPKINADINREETIKIAYYDLDFNRHEKYFSGFTARVILHEFDHIEGILFPDYLGPIKRRMMKGKLEKISKGDVKVSYKMKFPLAKKKRR